MVWKISSNPALEQPGSEWAAPITNELLDQVMRGKLRSTYQSDFLGVPQGYQMKSAFEGGLQGLPDWRSNVPYSLDSYQRHIYRKPEQQAELRGNITRYASNRTKAVPACGGAPAASARQMHMMTSTHYDTEFNDTDGQGGPRHVRDMARVLGAQSIQNYLNTATGKEKEQLERMIHTMNSVAPPAVSAGRSNSRAYRYKMAVPPADKQTKRPDWVSNWTGPM